AIQSPPSEPSPSDDSPKQERFRLGHTYFAPPLRLAAKCRNATRGSRAVRCPFPASASARKSRKPPAGGNRESAGRKMGVTQASRIAKPCDYSCLPRLAAQRTSQTTRHLVGSVEIDRGEAEPIRKIAESVADDRLFWHPQCIGGAGECATQITL